MSESCPCGASITNGLAMCELCQRKASTILEFLPIYFRNLARWRPGRAGSRPVPGSRVLYDGETRFGGTGDRISDSLDEAALLLAKWSEAFTEDRGFLLTRPLTFADAVMTGDLPDETAEDLRDNQAKAVLWLCAALNHHLVSLATLEWAGEFLRDLDKHERRLRSLTETSVPGWYAGGCKRQITMETRCGADTFVVPGLTWVKCQRCGTTTFARDHAETILNEARGWVALPKRIAEAIVALVDTELSVTRVYDRIRQWEHRANTNKRPNAVLTHAVRRLDRDGDPAGAKRYRFGEVLDMVLTEQEESVVSDRLSNEDSPRRAS